MKKIIFLLLAIFIVTSSFTGCQNRSSEAVKYILSDNYGEKEWNEWLIKAKSLGTDTVIEQYNKAQVRYDAL